MVACNKCRCAIRLCDADANLQGKEEIHSLPELRKNSRLCHSHLLLDGSDSLD